MSAELPKVGVVHTTASCSVALGSSSCAICSAHSNCSTAVQPLSLQLHFVRLADSSRSQIQCSYTQQSVYQRLQQTSCHSTDDHTASTSHTGIVHTTSFSNLLYSFVCPEANALHVP